MSSTFVVEQPELAEAFATLRRFLRRYDGAEKSWYWNTRLTKAWTGASPRASHGRACGMRIGPVMPSVSWLVYGNAKCKMKPEG